MLNAGIASNMNAPAPLAVLGFVAASGGSILLLTSSAIAWFIRKPKIARRLLLFLAVAALIYLGLLCGFSAASHTVTLPRGQEKYFCEIDCHLAYSVVDVDVKTESSPPALRYHVKLRTRFDETTTSPSRPKDAPLVPSPRIIRLVDSRGNDYAPIAVRGTPLLTSLKPADSYTTDFEFDLPEQSVNQSFRLLLQTAPGWPDRFVIGDENSWFHQKTYFAL